MGICGLGTVASGLVNIINRQSALLRDRADADLRLVHIGARRDNPVCDISPYRVSRDIFQVVDDPEVDIVIELIGGTTAAKELVERALHQGKHVITANKALIAEHGNALFALAESKGLALRFEAAVAGGIPIVKTLREGLAGNQIEGITGIINGTGNYILSEMASAGRSFDEVLKEAQALGYAEADPTFDIDGTDAAQKLVILASIAFGIPLAIDAPFKEGIDRVGADDLEYAQELGYRIKHLGIARIAGEKIDLRVHPTLIPEQKSIASIDGVLNAVQLEGDAVGEVLMTGAGAGAGPTASAVCADLIDLARSLGAGQNCAIPALGVPLAKLQARELLPREAVTTPWYLRIIASDKAGVMAEITQLLGEEGISIESLIQKAPERGETHVPIIILTDAAAGGAMQNAVLSITALDAIQGDIVALRVEDFEEHGS
ncbi:homoserine dehydrogenase [Luminiphilus syltensis NOR5-1B]|uniref:Homoserine dehydrogenase n=1 Tax=Luminiphilus syltensis NOR5-1B TaxID=565045 RepID=B8KXD7_9GAMM|nr:homoserine dehydrogenase [Luminiphilus syltensis NOR5-1B]